MVQRFPFKLVLAVLYLGLLFAGAGAFYHWMSQFEGEILVALHATESVVVRPSAPGVSLALAQRRMPAEVIFFDNPQAMRGRLGSCDLYDAVQLPFRLCLDEVEVLEELPPRHVVEVTGADGRTSHEVSVGTLFPLGEVLAPAGVTEVTVSALRPWCGLVRATHAVGMAMISLREGRSPWREHVFLYANTWRFLDEGVALRFAWFADEAKAKARLPERIEGSRWARWGIADGHAVHWFNTFLPGTGSELADGREVTLVAYRERAAAGEQRPLEETPPSIQVAIRDGDRVTRQWVDANAMDDEALVRFEDPRELTAVLLLNAWRDGTVLAAAYSKAARLGMIRLDEGKAWKPSEVFPCTVRLDQAMVSAVPIEDGSSPFWEAHLSAGEDTIRLREGLYERIGETRLRYRRVPTPPVVRYTFAAIHRGGAKKEYFELGPGEHRRVGHWVFASMDGNPKARDFAILTARRTWGGVADKAGLALFVTGAGGLVLVRFRRRVFRSGD